MWKLIIIVLLAYWGARIVGRLLGSGTSVSGKAVKKPLDLSDEDVEDVDFKETKE
jgi:hypothetical protein